MKLNPSIKSYGVFPDGFNSYRKDEACIGVLGIQDICHFTSRDIGYFPFYFQGYGMLCSIFGLLSGILNILEN